MRQALGIADFSLLSELIGIIDADHPALARRLVLLADNYDFDSLQEALNPKELANG